ncbi:Flp pilus assembly protein TadD [Kitasatospora gansuensis]|uniref:Flp pilus assembly protein TadD n=1 Tax=Kitasatospora gansuensis TaxID=258050 RepID=A0A7W7SGK3_9ACTN|nr:tetratricopeptide repeat protein [Kitasatospora gansuensis]MBB4949982.1 Flp pilus assembly protein TadD [Kitasatospora gansuensis]
MSYQEFQRATLFFDSKDYAGAAEILTPIVEADPSSRAAAELLARSYFHSAQLGRAEQAFRRLIELDPGNGWAYEVLARTLERRGEADQAARYRKLARAMGEGGAEGAVYVVQAANLAD